jgi:hypothetical protein
MKHPAGTAVQVMQIAVHGIATDAGAATCDWSQFPTR